MICCPDEVFDLYRFTTPEESHDHSEIAVLVFQLAIRKVNNAKGWKLDPSSSSISPILDAVFGEDDACTSSPVALLSESLKSVFDERHQALDAALSMQ